MIGYSKHTLFHKAWLHDKFFQEGMQGQALWINNQAWRNRSPYWLGYIEVVCQGNALALCDCFDLVLAVTIECRPLNRRRALVTPVKRNLFSLVLNDQVAAFERRGQANNQRADLALGSWCVNMLPENARWSRVNLWLTGRLIFVVEAVFD